MGRCFFLLIANERGSGRHVFFGFSGDFSAPGCPKDPLRPVRPTIGFPKTLRSRELRREFRWSFLSKEADRFLSILWCLRILFRDQPAVILIFRAGRSSRQVLVVTISLQENKSND